MDFLLDPFIVALPDSPESNNGLENYAVTLSLWTNEISKGNHKFWISGWILSALFENKQYPTWENIKKLSWDQSVFSAYDLFRSCEKSLVTPPYIEDEFKNGHFHYNLTDAIVLPDKIEQRLKPEVAQALKETLIYIAIAKEIYQNPTADNLFFATTSVPNSDGKIYINTTVDHFETNAPQKINSEWKTALSPIDLDEMRDLSTYWQDTNKAMKWAYLNLCRKGILNEKDHKINNIKIGARFNDSIKRYHFDNQSSVLPSIFEALVRVATGEFPRGVRGHHELRISDESSSPPKVRQSDGAIGWRVWVTKDRFAVRLHYWLIDEKTIEFSKVGPHEDYNID